jgi:dienelactone hydrolase
MQHVLTLTAADGVPVPVTIDSREKNTSGVLCLHGFTSSIKQHLWFNAAAEFPGKGFDTWRLPFYPGGNGRQMRTITWEQHLGDIKLALDEMKKRYKNIFIVGHSLGASLGIEAADASISALALLDPPTGDLNLPRAASAEIHPDFYTFDWGELHIAPKAYCNEITEHLQYANISVLPCPTLLIRASGNTEIWPDRLKCKTKVIRDSDHSFALEGNEKAVFGHTLRFMREHLGIANKDDPRTEISPHK